MAMYTCGISNRMAPEGKMRFLQFTLFILMPYAPRTGF